MSLCFAKQLRYFQKVMRRGSCSFPNCAVHAKNAPSLRHPNFKLSSKKHP
jgi:hypothetical protein